MFLHGMSGGRLAHDLEVPNDGVLGPRVLEKVLIG